MSTRDVKSLYLNWKDHYKKVKAMVCCTQKPGIYAPELLPEVDLVQRVLARGLTLKHSAVYKQIPKNKIEQIGKFF